jgi:hypothetical protein
MSIEICRRIILVCVLVASPGLYSHALSQSSRPALPKSHRHLGIDKSAVGDAIPEFSMAETVLAAGTKKENLVTSRSREFDAFTVSGTRLFLAERRTGKIFEIRGLPLEWRPFSDLIWADRRTLMFDRWSQPHYGVHYAVDVVSRRLVAAVPFPDKLFLDRQRPRRRKSRRG